MANYSVVNLRDVADVAPQAGLDSVQEARFPADDLAAEKTGFALHTIKPNKRGAAHRHKEAEEVYVVLEGGGRVSLDGDVVDLSARDAVRVAPTTARAFEAGPQGMELLAFGARHAGDGELLPDADIWG